jgi:predicted transcriptional regulator
MDRINKTDFKILEALDDGERNIAANIALEIDANRGYINNRFSYLLSRDLVQRVGPKEQSGLYQITAKGKAAVNHKQKCLNNEVDDFESFVEERLSEQTNNS